MDDPDLPLNCPKCGQPVRYEQTFRDVHVSRCTRHGLLRASVTQGRTVLQRVLHGRVTFTRD